MFVHSENRSTQNVVILCTLTRVPYSSTIFLCFSTRALQILNVTDIGVSRARALEYIRGNGRGVRVRWGQKSME